MKELSWEKIRKQFRKVDKKIVDTDKCKSCVWANTESGKILCSRYSCVKEERKNDD